MRIIAIPSIATIMGPRETEASIGPLGHITSAIAIIKRFTILLPKAAPAAKSGALASVIELMPVASSGKEVAVANKTIPTNVCPRPILVAILAEEATRYFEDIRINIAAAINCIQRRISKV
jgi:hypothetical protein